jgi:hypothetical protein
LVNLASPLYSVLAGEVCVGSSVGVEASVLAPMMEISQDIVAGEGFRADDGATGVNSVPVTSFTPPETGSSSPVTSEGGVVPSSDFGLPVVNNAEDSSTTLFVLATPAISPFIPEWVVNVELVSGSPEVSVAGLESLGFGDPGESSVQGSGSVPVPVELAGEEKTLALVSPLVEQDPGMAVGHSLPAKVSDDTNFDTFFGLSVQDKAYMDTSSVSAL